MLCFADTLVVTLLRAPACAMPPLASHLPPFLLDGGPGLQAQITSSFFQDAVSAP